MIQLIKPLSNWLVQPFTQAACTFINFVFLSLLFARNPIDTGFREIGQTDREINRKGVMQVIRVTTRILLLPWIQWVTIQVIESYETNGFFSVQISWITRITDPGVQTSRPLWPIIRVLR